MLVGFPVLFSGIWSEYILYIYIELPEISSIFLCEVLALRGLIVIVNDIGREDVRENGSSSCVLSEGRVVRNNLTFVVPCNTLCSHI